MSTNSQSPTDVKTLYISGLPYDVKEREIQLLCRPYSGFEFCNLNTRGDIPAAFVKFSDRESASTALNTLQGYQFDLNHPDQVIRVEFARSDTMKKNLNLEDLDDGPYGSRRRPGTGSSEAPSSYFPDTSYYQSSSYPPPGYPAPSSYYAYGYPPSYPTSSYPSSPHGSSGSSGNSSSLPNPPSNTLFVGNLPPYCSENDVSAMFRVLPGYKQLRFTNLKNRQVAFVQFVDTSSASFALTQMTGRELFGNRLRLEYAQESRDHR